MSEELFGGPALERDAGFTPMEPPQPSEPQDIGSNSSSLRDAAHELTEARDAREAPPDVIEYKKPDKHGRPTQERTDPKETVTRERAARDLAAMREAKSKAEEREAEQAIRNQVDGLRQNQNANTQPQYTPAQTEAQQNLNNAYQSERTPYQQWREDVQAYDAQLVAAAKDPATRQNVQYTQAAIGQKLRELDNQISEAYSKNLPWQALGAEYEHTAAAFEQVAFVERAQLAMAAGMSAKVATAVADREVLQWITQGTDGIKAKYDEALSRHHREAEDILNFNLALLKHGIPELQNCHSQEQIDSTINAIRMNNPVRGQAIGDWFQGVNRAVAHAISVREEVAKATKAKFQTWATNEDNLFRSRNTEFVSPETQKTVALEAFDYLESKGISRDEAIQLHSGDAMVSLRQAAVQEILWEAMQFRRMQKARENLPNKRYQAPVHVLKPGSSEDRIDADRSEKLPSSMNVKEAANILNNRRAKRR